jgi:Glycosyl transferases group 1
MKNTMASSKALRLYKLVLVYCMFAVVMYHQCCSYSEAYSIVCSQTAFHDSGGAQRAAQLTRALVKHGVPVVFTWFVPSHDSTDGVAMNESELLKFEPLDRLVWMLRDIEPHTDRESIEFVLVEFPHAKWLPLLQYAQRAGAKIVYDAIDEWDSALGWWSYDAQIDLKIASISTHFAATVRELADKLPIVATDSGSRRRVGAESDVLILPNAYNADMFDAARDYMRPRVLDQFGENTRFVTYVGALWGSWLDWQLVRDVAEYFRTRVDHIDVQFMMVGHYQQECGDLCPSNVNFVGLIPHSHVPAYLEHSHVLWMPWSIDEITLATSPLKAYEYLAMRRPVVGPKIPALQAMPAVWTFQSADEATAFVLQAVEQTGETGSAAGTEQVDEFLRHNSWDARVKELLKWLDVSPKRSTRIEHTAISWHTRRELVDLEVATLAGRSEFAECTGKVHYYFDKGMAQGSVNKVADIVFCENVASFGCPTSEWLQWDQVQWRLWNVAGVALLIGGCILSVVWGVVYVCVL